MGQGLFDEVVWEAASVMVPSLTGCGKTFSPTSKRNIYDDKAV